MAARSRCGNTPSGLFRLWSENDRRHKPTRRVSRLKEADPMPMSNLHDVFVDLVKDLYHAEKQLVKALPKMAKAASNDELKEGFEEHLEQTREHVDRLDQCFKILGEKARSKTCHAMQGLVEEGKEAIEEDAPDSIHNLIVRSVVSGSLDASSGI